MWYLYVVALPKEASSSNAPDSVSHHFHQTKHYQCKHSFRKNYYNIRVILNLVRVIISLRLLCRVVYIRVKNIKITLVKLHYYVFLFL
jgi:hypothetical protein